MTVLNLVHPEPKYPELSKMARAVNWCFTINNWEEKDIIILDSIEADYLIYGKEVGKEGTTHLKGFVQLKERKRLAGMKKIHKTAHWKVAKGSAEENKEYWEKEGDSYERGNIVINGRKKVNMEKCVNQVLDVIGTKDLLKEHVAGYIMNRRRIMDVANAIKE